VGLPRSPWLRLRTRICHRGSIRNPARVIRAVPIRILRQVLLVIVSPDVGNPTNSRRLLPRLTSIGRLSVDGDVDPAVDQPPLQCLID
jgi:hypothetical protein